MNVRANLFSPTNFKCVEVNALSPDTSNQKRFKKGVDNALSLVQSLERSIRKSTKYEKRLMQCQTSHGHCHDVNEWWGSEDSGMSFKCSSPDCSKSSRSSTKYIDAAESWSTISIVCLQYQYEKLSKRYESLLQVYNDRIVSVSSRDAVIAQMRRRVNATRKQLANAYTALLTVGEMYLKLKMKRNDERCCYKERMQRMSANLRAVVQAVDRSRLDLDCLREEST